MIQRWIFSIITPVSSVTWSLKNKQFFLICCLVQGRFIIIINVKK